jgi:hypothetical protein
LPWGLENTTPETASWRQCYKTFPPRHSCSGEYFLSRVMFVTGKKLRIRNLQKVDILRSKLVCLSKSLKVTDNKRY